MLCRSYICNFHSPSMFHFHPSWQPNNKCFSSIGSSLLISRSPGVPCFVEVVPLHDGLQRTTSYSCPSALSWRLHTWVMIWIGCSYIANCWFRRTMDDSTFSLKSTNWPMKEHLLLFLQVCLIGLFFASFVACKNPTNPLLSSSPSIPSTI